METRKSLRGDIYEYQNLKFIKPTEYVIKSPTTLTIYEYKANEISNKPFYIKELNQKYNLNEIKEILIKFQN